MKKRGGLRRLFNKCAAATLLSASLFTTASAQVVVPPPPVAVAATMPSTATSCPAFPDFKRPTGAMRRVPRDRTIDLELRADQLRLKTLGINPGETDGLGGNTTRAAIREFLLFYAPLYNGDANKYTLNAKDSAELKKYASQAALDARAYKITKASAAALGLAAARTNTTVATLAKGLHKFDNPTWLYMVKTYGASYGMEFYAARITLDAKGNPSVDNPFVHRQLLGLKDHPLLSALMTGEYLRHKNDIPVLDNSSPATDPSVQAQQTDLMALGFDVGKSADGIKGDLTEISIAEFQMLFGNGKPTGTLDANEAKSLHAAAIRAVADGDDFNAPTLAAGPIRLASDQSGADFGYMMKLAQAESSFSHTVRASTSSATGLYQFIESTWSSMILNYGEKHGLGDFAGQVEIYKDDFGRTQARVPNPLVRKALLDLRANPQLSALFGADFQDENKAKEGCYVDPPLTRTDLYLAHFLGPSDAVWFLMQMKKNPDQSAPDVFPEEAEYNEGVFYAKKHGGVARDRSLQEVYDVFARKFGEDPPQVAVSPVKTQPKFGRPS